MVFQFKIFAALAPCVMLLTSCNKDDADALYGYRLETRNANFGLDTLEANSVYSSLVNINKLKLKFKGLTNNPRRAYEFEGETDTSNKFFLYMDEDFFPVSTNGIQVIINAYGALNSIPGQGKCDLFNTEVIGVYRTLPNGNCQFYLPSVDVNANVILPGNPKFKASVLLEFPVPRR